VAPPTRYLAPLLATTAIVLAIGCAPVALAGPGSTAGGPNGASHGPSAGDSSGPADPPSGETLSGSDPLVPSNTGADPYVLVPPGYDLPS